MPDNIQPQEEPGTYAVPDESAVARLGAELKAGTQRVFFYGCNIIFNMFKKN